MLAVVNVQVGLTMGHSATSRALIIICAAVGICAQATAATKAGTCSTDTAKAEAQAVATTHITSRLVAPATAEFSDWIVKVEDECRYRMIGSVDSQNTFGALLRKRFYIDMKFDPDSGTYDIKHLSLH